MTIQSLEMQKVGFAMMQGAAGKDTPGGEVPPEK
jgi:hypothetical protein